jgi:hypothetical protein
MREFAINIQQELRAGIAPDPRLKREEAFLFDAYNVVCRAAGLETFVPFTHVLSGVTPDWPFPQIIRMRDLTLLCGRALTRELAESTNLLGSNITHNPATGLTNSITGDGRWHVADLGGEFYLFNGTTVVFKSGLEMLNDVPQKCYATTSPHIETGCAHRGRVVFGGFVSPMWPTVFTDIFDRWSELFNFSIPVDDLGPNWVMWSSIGGGDFPLWLFHPIGFAQNVEVNETLLLETLKRNEFGWMPLPTRAPLIALIPMGDSVIACSKENVFRMRLAGGTYGLSTMSKDVGVMNRGAIAGSEEDGYVFVSNNNRVQYISPEFQVDDLGFEQHMALLNPSLLTVIYHERERDWFISDGVRAFMLAGRQRMTEVNQRITTIWVQGSNTYGIGTAAANNNLRVITQEFDLGIRGIKTVTNVQLGYRGAIRLQVALDYRYRASDSFRRTAFRFVNQEGIVTFPQAGTDFRVVVKARAPMLIELDYIQVRWQSTDKRGLRGPAASSLIQPQVE